VRKTSSRRAEIPTENGLTNTRDRIAARLETWHLCDRSDGVAIRLDRSCLAHFRTRIDSRGIRPLHPGCWFARQHKLHRNVPGREYSWHCRRPFRPQSCIPVQRDLLGPRQPLVLLCAGPPVARLCAIAPRLWHGDGISSSHWPSCAR
jgi:hypothetical protein